MIKALFLDVDGTLYSHTISDIPASALSALSRLHEKGIRLFLATGRHRLALLKLNLHHFPFDGYVTLTGHLCYDSKWTRLFAQPLPESDRAILVETFHSHRLSMMLTEENRQYLNYIDPRVAEIFSGVSSKMPEISDYEGAPLYSVALYCNPEEAQALERELPGCRLSAWHPNGYDIISRDAGKVQGIEKMLHFFGFRREEVAVFGDAENDMEMISWAGTGIAMGNAAEKTKAVADYVTTSVDEDGLWNACAFLGLL